jgi:hypothetical protein
MSGAPGSSTSALDWEERYRAGTAPWERHGLNPAFHAWEADGTLKPCRILIPGAGRSAEPLVMARAGYEVTIVDLAESAIAVQRESFRQAGLPGVFVQADLFAWEPEAPFQAVYDQTCLCALPPRTWPDYAARLRRWIAPGGRLLMLFMQREEKRGGPPYDCDLTYMRELFPAQDWIWPEPLPAAIDHPLGTREQPAALTRRG